MTRPCGCGGAAATTCNCAIVPGPNTQVSGTGTPEDPYVITGSVTAITVADTATVDMSLAGDGSGTPYEISGQVQLNPTSNLITATGSGLLVACGSVRDCVAEALGPGLTFNAADGRFEVDLSTEPGNIITVDDSGGLYASPDGTIVPARPRARVGKAAPQEIPNSGAWVVQFDQPITDNAGILTAVGRLTAPVDGGYDLGVTVQWANVGTNTGHRAAFLRLNGSQLIAGDQRQAPPTVSTIQTVATSHDLVAGDYMEVTVQHSHSTALNLLAANDFVPVAWMYLTTEGLG